MCIENLLGQLSPIRSCRNDCALESISRIWNESRFECFKGTRSCYLVPAITGIGMSEKRGIISFLCMTLVVLIWSGSFIFHQTRLERTNSVSTCVGQVRHCIPPLVIYTLLVRKRRIQLENSFTTFPGTRLTGGTFCMYYSSTRSDS